MQGVITRVQVLAHPIVIIESFGVKVLVRALFSGERETFLEIVTRAAEEEAHEAHEDVALVPTVRRFIGFERRVGEIYAELSRRFSDPAVSRFFATLAGHEEGHALALSRVLREVRRGHLWKPSRDLHLSIQESFEATLASYEDEVRRGVRLARALEIVEAIEGSEVNVVFDTLSGCVDLRSRCRFERFFVNTRGHLAYCQEQVAALRARA
jgi:hypothetical protein